MELYLANPFPTRRKTKLWEEYFEELTGIKLLNPFYEIERDDITEIDAGRKEKYDINPVVVVQRDIAAIAKCDGIVAIVNGALSYGTIMEIVYANILQKPVYIICTNGHEKHPWLVYHATEVFVSFGEFQTYITSHYVTK